MLRLAVAASLLAFGASSPVTVGAGTAPVPVQAFGGLSPACVLGCKAAIDDRLAACGADSACKEALAPEFSSCVQECGESRNPAKPVAEGNAPFGDNEVPVADKDGLWADADADGEDAGDWDSFPPNGEVPVADEDGFWAAGAAGAAGAAADGEDAGGEDATGWDAAPSFPPEVDAANVDAVCVRACSDTYATCVPSCVGESHCLNSCAKTYDLCVRKCINLPVFVAAADEDADGGFGLDFDGASGSVYDVDGALDDFDGMADDDFDGMADGDFDGMADNDADGMPGDGPGADADGDQLVAEQLLEEEEEEVMDDILAAVQPCLDACEGSLQACLVGSGALESGKIPDACENGMRGCMAACLGSAEGDAAAHPADLESNAV